MTNDKMPIFSLDDKVRQSRKQKYYNEFMKYYGKAQTLSVEEYNEIRDSLNDGDVKSLETLMDKSVLLLVDAVCKIYAKYDIEAYLPIEEGLSISIMKFNEKVLAFTDLPVLYSQYKNSVINYYVYLFVSREYENCVCRYDGVDIMDDVSLTRVIDQHMDCVENHKKMTLEELSKQLEKVGKKLTTREECVLRLKFGFETGKEMSYSEIGAIFGMSSSRIQEIAATALRKLRQPKSSKILENFRDIDMDL